MDTINTHIFSQEKECPVCLKKFSVSRVKSNAYSISKRDSDFFVHYHGTSPLPYSVWVCPHCHYAATEKDFGKFLSTELRQKLIVGLKVLVKEPVDLQGERDFAKGLKAFELAILSGQVIKAPSGYLAPLFLRASWLARLIKNDEKQLTYLEQARLLYTDFYMHGNLERMRMSEQGTLYLIAELHRKVGLYDEAISWFAKAIAIKDVQPELERLIRDQWGLARQQARGEVPPDSLTINMDNEDTLGDEGSEDNQSTSQTSDNTNSFCDAKANQKLKTFVALYQKQLDWLKINNFDIDKTIRGILDAVIESEIDFTNLESEEKIKSKLKEVLTK